MAVASFSPGDGVEIFDLSARADLNGRFGRLHKFCGDRWVVSLDQLDSSDQDAARKGDSACVKVRPANLHRKQTAIAWSRDLNAQAAALQKRGSCEAAEQLWTRVLDILADGSDLETMKVLYSNRSSSRLKQGKAAQALSDAERCVDLDITWEKGWLRKIDALEGLGEIARAYDAALDAKKALSTRSGPGIQERFAQLAARPETQGFLRDEKRRSQKGLVCCACDIHLSDTCAGSVLQCQKCTRVRYCGQACSRRDADAHRAVCKAFQAVRDFDEIHESGRLWRGSCDESGNFHEYRVLIDGARRLQFPLRVTDQSTRAQSMTTWHDWADVATSSPTSWSRDSVSQVISREVFRRIVIGDDLETKEERVLHGIATELASFPLTLFQALRNFGLLRSGRASMAPLVIHVIGAEAGREGTYTLETQAILQTLVGLTPLLIVYIGPLNLQSPCPEQDAETFRRLRTCPQPGSANSFFFRGTYADFLGSALYSPPDVVMAFHPGFHDGTYPWWPTLQFLLHEDVPLALTCFSDQDLEDTRRMVAAEDQVFGANIVFGESDSRNRFASHFMVPVVDGKNEVRASNLHLLGLRGILKRFPKGGGVFDASHMEVMAQMVAAGLQSDAEPCQTHAEVSILQDRGRSYVKFAAALEKMRPCVGNTLVSVEHPAVWQWALGLLGVVTPCR